jgi:cob(I)alamin adenosyltransferase
MVRIDTVVTRGGDGGETSLGDGARVRKDATRIIAIGAVDEANATIGLLRLHTAGTDGDDACSTSAPNCASPARPAPGCG